MAEGPLIFQVIFRVKNDKHLGILILTIRGAENQVIHFFRDHQQPLNQHPEQVQEAMKINRPSVGRQKDVRVDIAGFLRHYWNGYTFEFNGVSMNSTDMQSDKLKDRMVNKCVGAAKRKKTIEDNKQRKIDEKNAALRLKFQKDEEKFQIERARRLAELFGPPNVLQPAGANQQDPNDPTLRADPIFDNGTGVSPKNHRETMDDE